MSRSRGSVALGSVVGLPLVFLFAPAAVSAHPLGSFSINHYNGLTVTPDAVLVDHVLDMSEIPTFSARDAMDTDGDGEVADREAATWAAASCASAVEGLRLSQDGVALRGSVGSSVVSFGPGQGALVLRLECALRWSLAKPLPETGPGRFAFRDDTYAERIGWREIVVGGEGVSIAGSDALSASTSDRLRSYPPDPLASRADQSSATFTARAVPATARTLQAAAGSMAMRATASDPLSAVSETLPDQLAAIIDADGLDALTLLVALAIAVGLGALHALSPGHGKTVMAAWLVGARGTVRTAIGLGLVVTVSHTAGVLLLSVITLGASSVVPVERLYPVLGLVSGLIVLGIGGYLLWDRSSAMRTTRLVGRHAHEHDDEADDPVAHGPHHHRGREHAHGPHDHRGHHQPRDREGPDADGRHAHGPFRHRHDLPDPRSGWRGLASLGLAGGMIPSASALILLLGAVSAGRPELGIVLTLAFGLGMALVLAGVGTAVVLGRAAVGRIGGSRVPARLIDAVPTLAGAVVIAMGVVMTSQALISLEVVGTG